MGSFVEKHEENLELHPQEREYEHAHTNGSTMAAERYAEDVETGEDHGLLQNGKPSTTSRRLFTAHGIGQRIAGAVLGSIGRAAMDITRIPSACRRLGFRGTMRTVFNYPERTGELRSTAWLDGLRGLAAFEVFVFHYMDGWMNHGLAWGDGEQWTNTDPHWYYLPVIRTLFASGDAAVCLFFGISGYVLTLRMLTLLRQQKHEQLLTSLSSAVFRRAIRLYMPVVVETFILMVLCRWFYFPKPVQYDPADSFYQEVRTWYVSFVHLLLPLRYPDRWDKIQDRYDGGISWTIPLEYYGSLFVYMILVLLARVQSIGIRRALIFAMVFCSFTKDDWIAAQFLLGMAFADYQLERQERLKHQRVVSTGLWERWARPLFFWGLAIFGFYMSGMPGGHLILEWDDDYRIWPRPLFDWILQPIAWTGIYYQRQADRYILCFATMASLMGFGETPRLRRILESRAVQYLGRISFGLYLCHIFMRAWLESVGISRHTALSIVGLNPEQTYFERLESDALRSFLAYVILMIPSTIFNFIGAGIFERYLDKPSVKAGRAFEQFCLSWNSKSQNGVIAPPRRSDTAIQMEEVAVHRTEGHRS